MSNRTSTWMPFYVGDYLRDTGRLTTENHGAYLLLLFDYWTSREPLPDDDDQLAAIVRLPVAKWLKARKVIANYFTVADGVWRHKRVDAEIERANGISKVRQAAGKNGGAAKANAVANAKQTGEQKPTPSPSQSPSEGRPSDAGASSAAPQPDLLSKSPPAPAQPPVSPPRALPTESVESDRPASPAPAVIELIPPFLVRVPDGSDISKVLFNQGLAWVACQLGKEPAKCRVVIGKWRQACGNDDRQIWSLLVEASKTGVADLPSWMMACLKPKGTTGTSGDDGLSPAVRAIIENSEAARAKGAA